MADNEAVSALVVRAQRGEKAAFAELAQRFMRVGHSVALAIVGRPADSEDVAQDAFVLALQRIGDCREPERFAGWFLQIVRNQARNWLERRRRRDVATPADVPTHELVLFGTAEATKPERIGLKERLIAALMQLTETQREVVLLHDLEEWTHPEISQALGISEVMSRQHLWIARRILRGHLEPENMVKVSHEEGR